MMEIRSTTIIGVRRAGKVAMAGDGQVTLGETIVKHTARKVRKMFDGKVLVGFAGSVADALTLFERFEEKLRQAQGNIQKAAVELAKDWRTDKVLRRLEALLGIMDREHSYIVSGTGDVIEPEDGIIALGSGGPMALAVAKALLKYTNLSAKEIVEEAIKITASICVYTNENIVIETLE